MITAGKWVPKKAQRRRELRSLCEEPHGHRGQDASGRAQEKENHEWFPPVTHTIVEPGPDDGKGKQEKACLKQLVEGSRRENKEVTSRKGVTS